MDGLATVHGAVNDFRTRILLDTGASVSIMSLDLARRLKLQLRTHHQIKVSDLGGMATYITHVWVKITLGWSMVYVRNIWVINIGEGIDVLLGMDFMHSADVRLCIREGLIKLPDDETVVMYDNYPRSRSLDLPVFPEEQIHLRPGQDAISNPQRELVWAGKGKNWVTKILYSARSWATAVKVFNVSDQNSMDSSQGNLDSFVLERRDMKSCNSKFMSGKGGRALGPRDNSGLSNLMRQQPQEAEVRMVRLRERLKPLDMTLKVTGNAAVVMKTVVRDSEGLEIRPEDVGGMCSDPGPESKVSGPEDATNSEDSVPAQDS
ncbi:hypothetical protein PHMEG_0002985 [Phytophthora megakarya]|uniref:Peptidase A2 domain-containing protein n=1 Tax=Phytophthora megakarya TaxID=4795 RepID=A0A225WX47_9STRA|nr:hypothetical protein PHMEG_0002985 [Phytophthora megakarya]